VNAKTQKEKEKAYVILAKRMNETRNAKKQISKKKQIQKLTPIKKKTN